MRKKIFLGSEFNQLPLYQPQPGHEDKASMGFDFAMLQRCVDLLRRST
jgi:hypothetical protein